MSLNSSVSNLELILSCLAFSDSKTQSTSATRRSSRLAIKDAGAQTPQDILRHSLGLKMREVKKCRVMMMMKMLFSLKFTNLSSFQSITRKPLPATKKRTASAVSRKTNTPAPASMPFEDGDTPRHILMNILRTGMCTGLPLFTHRVALVCCPFNHVICHVLQSL